MEYYLIAYVEKQDGSLIWDHCNEVIDYDPVDWIIDCSKLNDRRIALTMVHKIDEVTFNKLKYVLG